MTISSLHKRTLRCRTPRALAPALRYSSTLLFLVGILAGCAGPEVPPPKKAVLRLLSHKPTRMLTASTISIPEMVGQLDLDRGAINTRWQLRHMQVCQPRRESAEVAPPELETTGNDPQLITTVDFAADEVHVVEITGSHLGPAVQLYWAGPGEPFSAQRCLSIASFDRTTSFETARHPLWRGRIDRLRIDPTSEKGRVLRVDEVRLFRHRIDTEKLEDAASHAWKVTLGAETRPATIVRPEIPLQWNIDARPGDHFVFSSGRLGGATRPTQFAITMTPVDGQSISVTDHTLPANPTTPSSWHEHRIELPTDRPTTVQLELAVVDDNGSTPPGMPTVVGSPRIVRRSTEELRPNIILISLDTLRPDHLSGYGYDRQTSPNIDAWCRTNSLVFDNAVASSPWTLPSHVSMLTGIDAVRHGVNYEIPSRPWPSITQSLADDGYETVAITGGAFLDPGFGFDTGFDSYTSWPPGADSSQELEVNMGRLVDWLERAPNGPFFAFFHTYEIHGPFRVRQPFFGRWSDPKRRDFNGTIVIADGGGDPDAGFTALKFFDVISPGEPRRRLREDEMDLAVDLYDAGIAYADLQLKRLFDTLERTGLQKNTVVILTSDHGQALGEKGLMGHAYLYDFNVMVPLIIKMPAEVPQPHRRVRQQVRLVDVAATILDLAGLPEAPEIDGVSLAPMAAGEAIEIPSEAWSYAAKTNYGISLRLDSGVKYIFNNTAWTPANGREEVYDLTTDPHELANNAGETSQLADLRRQTNQHIKNNVLGLQVRIVNQGAVDLRGTFELDRDQDLLLTKVKGHGVPDNGIVMVSDRALEWTATAGSDFLIHLEDLRCESIRIIGSSEQDLTNELDFAVSIADATEPLWIARTSSGWSRSTTRPVEADAFIRIELRGTGFERTGTDTTIDPELAEQLRILGYAQ